MSIQSRKINGHSCRLFPFEPEEIAQRRIDDGRMSGRLQPWQVASRQAMSYGAKVNFSLARIRQWYEHWNGKVYVSFSGGKDSTVLLHLVRSIYPDVPGVFFDTGLEYPEIREHVKKFENIIWIKPQKSFSTVIREYGYPVVSKHISKLLYESQCGNKRSQAKLPKCWRYLIDAPFKISDRCCYWLKKEPADRYTKQTGRYPFLGNRVVESRLRMQSYLKYGCNGYSKGRPSSVPLAIWLDENVNEYIERNGLELAKIYDSLRWGTGCMFCMFGVQFERQPNRFQRMKESHPRHYNLCINKLGLGEVLDYVGVAY